MKKIIFLYILIFSFTFSQGNIEAYKSFIQGKESYMKGDYEQAQLEFDRFLENYRGSKLMNSHYPDFYIGMNYYELGELKKALKFLDSSIYTPKYLKLLGKKSNYFEYERSFYLGDIQSRLGAVSSSEFYYLSLVKDYYSPELEPYEKKALNILGSKDPYYKYILEAKYQNKYDNLNKLKKEDIYMIGRFLYTKGLFLEFYNSYKKLIKPGEDSEEMIIYTLSILEELREYNLMIDLIKKQPKMLSEYYFYWGNALKKLDKPLEAIEKYKLVDKSPYLEQSIYFIGRIYFVLGDYDNAILWSKKLKGNKGHELLTRSYFNSGQMDLFKKSAIQYIKKYPNSDLAGYYRNLLYNESKNPNYLVWIIKHNLNSYYYQVAYNITKSSRELEEYPINYKIKVHKDSLALLDELSSLGDPQLLIIESDNINFPNDKVFEHYIRTYYLEKNKLYNLAMKSSTLAEDEFSKYSNLNLLLHPRYYNKEVSTYSKEYDVEDALVYSVIKVSSKFDKNLIDKSTYFGLMQLSLKIAKKYDSKITPKKLLDPNINIKIGTKYLADLLTKYDGNISLAIASFHNSEEEISKWKRDKNGDIDVEQIPYLDSQEYIKHVIANYYKYKSLYKN